MSGKNQTPITSGPNGTPPNTPGFSWQSINPATSFLPLNLHTQSQGSIPSGVINGVMTGTNTIYSQIVDVSRMDNIGLEVNWTGTPAGTLTIDVSISGINFYPLSSYNNTLPQPAGSAGGYPLTLTLLPYKYFMLKYINASGTGVLNVYGQLKDLN